MENWHLATCKTGFNQQDRAEDSLLSQMLDVFNPKVKVEQIKHNVIVTTIEPMFPGYIFVKFDPAVKSASIINNSRGIRRLVAFGDNLAKVDSMIIEELKIQTEQKIPTVTKLPQPGDVVEIKAGPLAGIKAIFKEPHGIKRSFLLIEMLGSTQRVEIENSKFAKS